MLRKDAADWRQGEFVKVRPWGFGKLRFADPDEATVEFFKSASDIGRFERTFPLHEVIPANPPVGARCFFLEDGWWRTGRLDWLGDDEAGITGDGDRHLRVPVARLYVRCEVGIDSPVDVIRAGALHHPGHAANRARFMTEVLRHRASGRGMTGLASSRIQLFPHQVEIASRVERDSVHRYLLADEVGLGKTIESGVILRQYLLDHPAGSAVVLVPPLLVPQWHRELVEKFGLDQLGVDRVRYVAHGERGWWRPGPGLLIVDEAHHLAAGFDSRDADARASYDELTRASRDAARLLLLSATPLLHNERTFLAMLHLLDPALYPLESLSEFAFRVASRRDFALRFQAFVPGAPDYVLEEHVDAFRELFPDDDVLAAHLGALESAIGAANEMQQSEIVHEARVHLGETYRLHQRVLRTRRGSSLARYFPVRGRRRPDRVTVAWARNEPFDEWLSEWLDLVSARLAGEQLTEPLFTLVLGVLDRWRAAPEVLCAYLKALLDPERKPDIAADTSPSERSAMAGLSLSDAERQHIRDLCSLLGHDDVRERWLSEVVKHVLAAPEKTVVFCSHTATATAVADELDRLLTSRSVGRYMQSESSFDELERGLAEFERGKRPYLVCDRAGEEGRNFQFAQAALHVDLPWSPNRLEQRVGRMDRYSEGPPVQSLVLVAERTVDDAWLSLLTDGYGLFDDSIATLQHVLDKGVVDAVQQLIEHGPKGLELIAAQLRDSLERERREIMQLENLESIEGEHVFGRGLFAALQDAELSEADLEQATEGWLCGTRAFPESIGLECRVEGATPTVRHYLLDRFSSMSMPSDNVLKHLGQYLGRTHRYTFRRDSSCRYTDVALVRPGETILDSLEDLTRAEDLGQTFAFWRRYPRLDHPLLVTAFTFRVEADIDRGASLLAGAQVGPDRREALGRTVDSFFAPRGVTVWLGVDGHPVEDEAVISKVQPSFNWRSDKHLSSTLISSLETMFEVDWGTWWLSQAEAAQQLAEHQADLLDRKRQSAARAQDAYEYARHQLALRLKVETDESHRDRLKEEILLYHRLEEAVTSSIEAAVAIPEAVGVVVLARETPHELFGTFDE